MTKFETWLVKRIIQQEVRQGPEHQENITNLYRMIRMAAEREFYEDNVATQNSYLTEWFENSLRKPTR